MVKDKTVKQIRREIVTKVNGRDVSHDELSKAFDRVKDLQHWKNPISKIIDLTEDERAVIYEAIVYFTGSEASFTPIGKSSRRGAKRMHVVAAGYFRTIGA